MSSALRSLWSSYIPNRYGAFGTVLRIPLTPGQTMEEGIDVWMNRLNANDSMPQTTSLTFGVGPTSKLQRGSYPYTTKPALLDKC